MGGTAYKNQKYLYPSYGKKRTYNKSVMVKMSYLSKLKIQTHIATYKLKCQSQLAIFDNCNFRLQ